VPITASAAGSLNARVAPRTGYGPVSRDLDASADAVAFVVDPAGFR
jgi:hypothetical protein